MKKVIALTILLSAPQILANAWVADGATIIQIASSLSPQVNSPAGSTDRFAIKVTGGTVATCHGPWIVFEKSTFGNNPEAYTRAYTLALAAYTTGTKVKVHNLNNTSCNGVTSIQSYK